jgi:hypothetical protein
VGTLGKEAAQACGGLRDGIRPGDAERVKSLRARRGCKRRLYGLAVGDQKSRLA